MDEHEFRDFYARTIEDVWRFARRRCARADEADDVTAETFAVAWRRRQEIPADAARPWLFGVARLVLSNLQRAHRRRQDLFVRLATVEEPRVHDAPAERDDAVWRSLAALTESDRDLLLMRAWDELSVAEIALVLDTTPATVSSRLYKARQRLAREIERRDPTPPGHVLDDPTVRRS